MVGRDLELARIRAAFDQLTVGRGRVLLIVGEAGIGKSRLVAEFVGVVRDGGGVVATGRANPNAASVPFRPFTEALVEACRGRAWRALVGTEAWSDVLATIMSGEVDGRSPIVQPGRDVLVGEAVLALLAALAATNSLVLVLEDAQWSDPDSIALLAYLADHLAERSVLVIATVREAQDEHGGLVDLLRGRSGVDLLELTPLTPAHATQMALLCRPGTGLARIDAVVAAADGVPLLIEELSTSIGVPTSLRHAVKERLAILTAEDRQIIETVALLGPSVDTALLTAAATVSLARAEEAMENAARLELLVRDGGGYRFRHSLTRDAVISLTPAATRIRQAESCLDRLLITGETPPALLAGLAVHAGRVDEAARLLLASGREAWRRGALATTVETLDHAAGLARDRVARCEALALQVTALAMAGRTDRCLAVGSELLTDQALPVRLRPRVELALAQAAVEASRWPVVALRLAESRSPGAPKYGDAELRQWSVIAAELALAERDLSTAHDQAAVALSEDASRGGSVPCPLPARPDCSGGR